MRYLSYCMVWDKNVPSCGSLGGHVCLPEVHISGHTTVSQYQKHTLYWNAEVRSQSKALPSRSRLALMDLLINKRLADKFPVVCLLGGVLLRIPATLRGCSAPLDPEECLLLSMTSEAWLSSAPHCEHSFLSGAPALHSMGETPSLLGFSFPTQPSVDSSNFSHLHVFSCSLYLSLFSGQGVYSAPRVNHEEEGQQAGFICTDWQLPLFQIIYDIPIWIGSQPVLKVYQQSHLIYSHRTMTERRDFDQSLIPTLPVFHKAKLSFTAKVKTHIKAQLWKIWSTVRCHKHRVA